MRTYSTCEPRTMRQALTTIRREFASLLSGTGVPAATFLRRAPRPNEIYGVVSLQSLADLVGRALARRAQAKQRYPE